MAKFVLFTFPNGLNVLVNPAQVAEVVALPPNLGSVSGISFLGAYGGTNVPGTPQEVISKLQAALPLPAPELKFAALTDHFDGQTHFFNADAVTCVVDATNPNSERRSSIALATTLSQNNPARIVLGSVLDVYNALLHAS